MYVCQAEHIEAHFLTCYAALHRILRINPGLTGGKYSAGTINPRLGAMCSTNLDGS